jgi:hypothetical protein
VIEDNPHKQKPKEGRCGYIFISDKMYVKSKTVTREKESHLMTKGLFHQENINIANICTQHWSIWRKICILHLLGEKSLYTSVRYIGQKGNSKTIFPY